MEKKKSLLNKIETYKQPKGGVTTRPKVTPPELKEWGQINFTIEEPLATQIKDTLEISDIKKNQWLKQVFEAWCIKNKITPTVKVKKDFTY